MMYDINDPPRGKIVCDTGKLVYRSGYYGIRIRYIDQRRYRMHILQQKIV